MIEEAVADAVQHVEEAFEEGDADWSGEFDIQEFITAFRTNTRFVRKVALAADVAVDDFQALSDCDLEELFNSLDTDYSGTLTIQEFAKGLIEIRLARMQEKKDVAEAEEEEALDEAYMEAAEAFDDADFGFEGELDLQAFVDAMQDPLVVDKVANATKVPVEFLASLNMDQIVGMFQQIDTDCSGSVSFNEWVTALVKIRKETYQAEQVEKKEIIAETTAAVEEAFEEGDEDWSGEFEFIEFLNAFRSNPRFLRKVSVATDIPVETFQMMNNYDLEDLFNELDRDYSGTVSFDEFVKGLVEIRMAREEEKKEEAAADEAQAMDDAYMDAADAFEDADFGYEGELNLEAFMGALQDINVLEKIAFATAVPVEYFGSLTKEQMESFFRQLDTDNSGTVSFNEWVIAMVKIRKETYAAEKQEEADMKAAQKEVAALAESAFDSTDVDWTGELEFEQFLHAFRSSPEFVRKVATATDLQVSDFDELTNADLGELFMDIDVDCSGTISFDEFVKALASLRLARQRAAEMGMGGPPAIEEPAGPPPYDLPEAIQKLPPLDDAQKEKVMTVYSKCDPEGYGLVASPAQISQVLTDLGLVVDDQAAKTYLERAFPERDLSWGLRSPDCEVLFQVALDALPLQSLPAKRGTSSETVTMADMRGQEDRLRQVFQNYAGPSGTVATQDVPAVLAGIGVVDASSYTPRFVNEFNAGRKPGPVRFPEIVDLCNATVDHMLDTSTSSLHSSSSKTLRKRASSVAKLGKSVHSCSMTYASTAPFGGPALGSSISKPSPTAAKRKVVPLTPEWAVRGGAGLQCTGRPLSRSSSAGKIVRGF